MRHFNKIILAFAFLLAWTSCTDDEGLEFDVDKPKSVELQEKINSYDALKSYVDESDNPDFILGAGVSMSDYVDKGVPFRLVNHNFEEITAGYGMKHGAVVQSDGSIDSASVELFLSTAAEAGLSVYGHTLVWHTNQNAEYLNELIAPEEVEGEPGWEELTFGGFETDDESGYEYTDNAVVEFTGDGEGAYDEGRALKVTNEEVRENDYGCQFFFVFSPSIEEVGERYELSMDVRADDEASFATQAQAEPFEYLHYDFFGAIDATPEWTTVTKEVTVTEEMVGAGTVAFNLGNTATSYYFDNIKISKYGDGGGSALAPSVVENSDFEDGTISGWGGWGNESTVDVSEEGEGFDGEGYALTFTNPSETDAWAAQVAYSLDPTLEMESTYQVDFKARANASGTISAELQSSSDYSSDGFGSIELSEEWEEYSFETTVNADDRDRLLFSYGEFAGTVYVDDITLSQVVEGGEVIEMTPEEKADTISAEMERWISGMMNVSSEYVNAWDVVNEPMDDGNPYELKTGEGAELADDEFYWQDYLGKDYAVLAFNLAREYGDDDDLLFINDYNLEYDLDKCKGIIEFVEYIEDNGATVDGIGTQMHLGIDSDKDKIEEMFELLAATGKLVKISELDIGVGEETGDATEEDYEAQAEMYKYVVEKYLEIVPAEQQYGITVWSPVDSPEGSAWRAGEPIGLWTEDYDRKRAYAAFANALAGEEVVELD